VQSRQLIKELEEAGWVLDRMTGSHHIFTHRYNPYTIPVPHPKKDLPLGRSKASGGVPGCTTRQPVTKEIHNAISNLH
jgi:predicted RNA binding protein YcfA (HicA-like mRNA interferase family)